MKRKLWMVLTASAVAMALVGGWAIGQGRADTIKPIDNLSLAQREAIAKVQDFSDGFVAVADLIAPSVVTITSEKLVQPADGAPFTFFNDDLFRRFFGQVPDQNQQPQMQRGLGSGVIVDPDGLILTNNHVIRGADELTVILKDGTHLDATVVGADPRSDLAVLRVKKDGLPAVTFGNSDDLKIGEWVMAVGSPFAENLEHTFTAGIVSGLGRSGMNLNQYEYFIQTDAAINPGNSGGALVDLNGEVVGINTAIVSRGGGSNGIGFAIPANLATEVMQDLINDGKVTRGYLGVGIQDLSQDMAEALGVNTTDGVLVRSVETGGPADKAGLEPRDIITALDGKPVKNMAELRMAVARGKPGTTTDVTVLRGGTEKDFQVKLAEYPEDSQGSPSISESERDDLGLRVEPITPQLGQRFGIEATNGLVVTRVTPGSPAGDAGVQPGDVIQEVNEQKVDSLSDYRDALDSAPSGKPVLVLLLRGENTFFVAIRPEK